MRSVLELESGSRQTATLKLWWDARRAKKRGVAALELRQRPRLDDLVRFARARSPFFGELYRDLPDRVIDPRLLPVTRKPDLMARFDDWVTDERVRLDVVRAFVQEPDHIGEPFAGHYTALTTSGTTGSRGIFLWDDATMAVTNAMFVRMLSAWLTAHDVRRIIAGRGRMAMIMAAGSHFASAAAAARLERRLGGGFQALPIDTPLPELVERLNLFDPAVIAPYASIAAILASEQDAGRLRIRPALLVLSAEGLPLREYDRISSAFDAKVRHSYAATECPFISYSCGEKWLHVNADWVVLEAVDNEYQPVPAGQRSHTVLVTNLANRVQPILRYDLGDSVELRPEPCSCGDPLPAIRVMGRAADVLSFTSDTGESLAIPPMAFVTGVERIPGIEQVQIVQASQTGLRVRMRTASGADRDAVWQAVRTEVGRGLIERGLQNVAVDLAEEPPRASAGGKYREVIPLPSDAGR